MFYSTLSVFVWDNICPLFLAFWSVTGVGTGYFSDWISYSYVSHYRKNNRPPPVTVPFYEPRPSDIYTWSIKSVFLSLPRVARVGQSFVYSSTVQCRPIYFLLALSLRPHRRTLFLRNGSSTLRLQSRNRWEKDSRRQCCGSGIRCSFAPRIRDPDHISESLETNFLG